MSELIAEARVLVTPDTTTFRPLLISQLATATKGVTVPVSVTPVLTGNAAASQAASQAAALEGAAAAADRVRSVSGPAAAAQAQLARSAEVLAVAERRAAAATSEVSAAQIRYRASISSTEITHRAYQGSLKTTDVLLQQQARDAFASAQANERLALSNLELARSEAAKTAALTRSTAAQAAGFRQISTGAGSAAASIIGVRGATLAATGPFLAGAAGAIALSKSLQLATSFNSEIAVLGATTGATGEQLETAAAAAREFGRDITLPGVTAGDAAQTITSFAKAGLDLNESLAATRGGLQLAQAAQISYADAVELTANSLNAFNLQGSQAVVVADTLANAANLSQGSITDVALALRQSAGAAQVVGVSFQDTIALLTQLAQNGLTGSDAGTALRTSFIRLVNPSKQARQILQDLNVQLRDLEGNVRPEVFQEFAQAQRDLSVAQQQANAAVVFGQDAFRVIGILGQEAPGSLDRVRAGLNQTGTAARIAQARMTGLRGASENLSNQLSALGETIGQTVTPTVTEIVNLLADGAAAASLFAGSVGDLKQAFDDLPGPESGDFFDAFKEGLSTGLQNLNPQAAQIFRFFGVVREQAEKEGDDTGQAVRNLGVDLRGDIEDAGREAARGARSFQSDVVGAFQQGFDQINRAIREGAAATRAAVVQSIGSAQGQAAGLDEQFDQIVAGGGSQQAQLANLRRQAATQARIIEKAGPDAAGVVLEARRQAQQRLATINQQIVSIEQQIANDQKQAQDEAARIAEQARNEAQRAFLQRQEDARTAQEQRITVAEDTPQLADDIRRQTELRALLQQQIAAIRTSSLDEKTKAEAIRALRAAVFATTQEIKGLKAAQAEQRAEQREAARDQLAENLSLRTQIAEARGQDDEILKALNAEIANQRKRVQAAKKARKGVLEEQLALEQLLRQRRELQQDLDDADSDAVGGTSLADLFEKAEQIASGAGNVGGQNAFNVRAQPRIQQEVQARLDIVNDPVKAAAAQQERSTQNLIQAIDRLTNAITGNSASGTPITRREQNQWRNMSQEQRFYYQRQAKQMVEQGLMG